MNIEWIIILGLLLFIIISGAILFFKKDQIQKNIQKQYLQKKKEELEAETEKFEQAEKEKRAFFKKETNQELKFQENLIEQKKKECEAVIEQLLLRQQQLEEAYAANVASEKSRLETEIQGYHAVRMEQIDNQLKEQLATGKAKIEEETRAYCTECLVKQTQIAADLKNIEEQLEDYKKRQQVVNEAILRQRALEEQQDFYRVVLSTAAIDDMQVLLSIRENLKSRENLDKLIYEVYISKPTQEMIKRVLEGRAPSGIYKITRLKTGEIYIGKSTDIKKRWGEHCKTAYGVGSIAHSILHTTIKKDGIQNFTFELLEEVPKDKLTEREKYWISFYGSKEYGLNERNG